jgi:hypothetical protein
VPDRDQPVKSKSFWEKRFSNEAADHIAKFLARSARLDILHRQGLVNAVPLGQPCSRFTFATKNIDQTDGLGLSTGKHAAIRNHVYLLAG